MAFLGPLATTSTYGLVQIGNNMSVVNGVISSTGSGSSTVGTWSPSMSGSGGTAVLTVNDAHYVKNGQLVTCMFDISFSTDTLSGNITLGGLPVTSITSGNPGYVGSVVFSAYFAMKNTVNFIGGNVVSNSTTATLWQDTGNSSVTVSNLDGSIIQPSTRLTGTVQYISAA